MQICEEDEIICFTGEFCGVVVVPVLHITTQGEDIDFVTASQFFTTNGSFYESEITIEM